MSFVALDSAKTLSPVQGLIYDLALFYACFTFVEIKLKGPTFLIFVNNSNLFVISPLRRFALGDSFFVARSLLELWEVLSCVLFDW